METIEQFMNRMYFNGSAYPPIVLVWKSKEDKEQQNKGMKRREKPERWDKSTCLNYLDYLREKDLNTSASMNSVGD